MILLKYLKNLEVFKKLAIDLIRLKNNFIWPSKELHRNFKYDEQFYKKFLPF